MKTELSSHPMNVFKLVIATCISLMISISSSAKTQDIDYLGLAALLISDGNFDRAEIMLVNVEKPNEEGEVMSIDYPQYHLLKGLLAFKRGDYEDAEAQYELSIEQGQEDKLIHIYLAQTHYKSSMPLEN